MRYYIFLGLISGALSALSLSGTVEKALTQSPSWQQQHYQYQGQLLNPSVTMGALLPSISTYAQQVSGGNYNQRLLDGENVVLQEPQSFHQTQVGVELKIPLYRPAQLALYQAATHQSLADNFSYQLQKEQFISHVIAHYFNVLLQAKNLVLSDRFLERRNQLYDDTRDKFEVGLVALSDLKAAEAFRDQAIARKIQARFLLTTAQEQLSNILCEEPQTLQDASLELDFIYPQHLTVQKTHYSLQFAQELVDKADSEFKSSKASLLPEVYASSNYAHQPLNSAGAGGYSQTSASLLVSWTPIQGALVPRMQQARYGQQAAKSARFQAARDYATKSFLAQQRLKTSIAQLAAERESLNSNKIYLATVEASYDAGQATITDVLHAQEAVTEQEMRVYQEIYDCLKEYFDLGLLLSYPYDDLLSTIDSYLNQSWEWDDPTQ